METYKFFLVLACLIHFSESACQFGPFTKSNGEVVCYFELEALDWVTARDRCKAQNAKLPVVESDEDNNILLGLNAKMWLGLNDIDTENVFAWDSGEQTSYTKWSGGEPNNLGDEDCTEMLAGGLWNDIGCSYKKRTLCEEPSLNCKQIANDKCDESVVQVLDRIPDITTMDNCQFWCGDMFADQCDFNILDNKHKQCLVVKGDIATYEQSCKRILGNSQQGSITDCLTSDNPCDHFVYEECTVNGELIQEFAARDVNTCNIGCVNTPGCNFFSFDNSNPEAPSCNHYKGGAISDECDLIRGPKSPLFSTC